MRRFFLYVLLTLGIFSYLVHTEVIKPVTRSDRKAAAAQVATSYQKIYVSFVNMRFLYLDAALPFFKDKRDLFIGMTILVLLYWDLPLYFQRRHVSRKHPWATEYFSKVDVLGAYAYIQYLKSIKKDGYTFAHLWTEEEAGEEGELPDEFKQQPFWKRILARLRPPKRPAPVVAPIPCPYCGKALNVPEFYLPALDFEKCPYCQGEVEPVFAFDTYIQEFYRRFPESRDLKARGVEDMKNSKYMADLLTGMYALAIRFRATDIHIKRDSDGAEVQMRIDGILNNAFTIPSAFSSAFLSSIKVQAHLDITNHSTPQDGRFETKVGEVEIDIRLNCAPTSADGEILFIRILDKRSLHIAPETLGFEGRKLALLKECITKPHGLILVTGPTGSGKTTTLYMALNSINTGRHNIVTIEDPVEYKIPGLKQMQVNHERNFNFATGLRSILRQDPDVIMVGEIRDEETANMAVESAATGHLVFTTLHTMDTIQAIARLHDLGIHPKRYAQALELIIAQRLVRLNCTHCVTPAPPPTPEMLQRLGIAKLSSSVVFKHGTGCAHCNRTGFYGRQAILEMFRPDADMRVMLEKEPSLNTVRDIAHKRGMHFLREDAVLKAVAGITTLEEITRVVN